MCGRFTLTIDQEQLNAYLNEIFDSPILQDFDHYPRYNIAPGQNVISVIYDGEKYRVGYLKWGFVAGKKSPQAKPFTVINIRQESLISKPMFKSAFKKQRCLIIADGFYEWSNENNQKQAYHIVKHKREIFAMAGLWDSYIDETHEKQFTCGIITTPAEAKLKKVHTRMPLTIDKKYLKKWLSLSSMNEEIVEDFVYQSYKDFELNPVSNYVNKVENDDIKCIKNGGST